MGGEFDDWVMTTAFYSAIHYIEHKMFPKGIDGISCNDINDARKTTGHNAHKTRRLLVAKYMPEIAAQYNYLSEECENSRYHNYRPDRKRATLAMDYLQEIVAYCTSTESGAKAG